MKTIYIVLLKVFTPVFVVTIFFFVLIFQLMDLFASIQHYVANNVSLMDILAIMYYYTPKCISYSIPVGFLFSITFVLGLFYTNNEMIAIFGSGISLYRLSVPFIIIGAVLCFSVFFFEEEMVIPSFAEKNSLYKKVMKSPEPFSNYNVAIKTADNTIVYQVNYYNDIQKTLTGITILERDNSANLVNRYEADTASWNGQNWVLANVKRYHWSDDKKIFIVENLETLDYAKLDEKPELFQRSSSRRIEEMNYRDAFEWVTALRKAGQSYQGALSEYFKKFAFAMTPIIVALISCSIGGILRRNVLLLSLCAAIGLVVVYYVVQMITMAMATNGHLLPFWGAFTAPFLFFVFGILLMRWART
ncbi:MAG: LptF/LptG family permease [Spirochaetales bacterium]|nr:LptF/LptG family permease [Spirochaetales bacterium]